MHQFAHQINRGQRFLGELETFMETDMVQQMMHYKSLYYKEGELFNAYKKEKQIEADELKLEVARLGMEIGRLLICADGEEPVYVSEIESGNNS